MHQWTKARFSAVGEAMLKALLKAPREGWTRREIQAAAGITDHEGRNGIETLRQRFLVRRTGENGSQTQRYTLSGLGRKAAGKGGAP